VCAHDPLADDAQGCQPAFAHHNTVGAAMITPLPTLLVEVAGITGRPGDGLCDNGTH
jgi:hypothetical protein